MYVVIIAYLHIFFKILQYIFPRRFIANKIYVIRWNIINIQQFKLLLWCDSVMQLQTKLNWKHLHVGRVTQDIFFPFSCSMTPKRLRCPFCSFCPSAHRQIMCVGLLAFVSKKFEPTRETITFSVEIVEGKRWGPLGFGDGDLLLGGLHLSCDISLWTSTVPWKHE